MSEKTGNLNFMRSDIIELTSLYLYITRMENNMTQGSPLKLILGFTLPTFIGNIFQQLYLMADTLIVSRLLGVEALAAVGAVSGYSFMVTGFAQGLTMGFTAIIAQRYGAGDSSGMRKAYTNGTILSLAMSIIVAAVFALFSKPLLELINTPTDIIDMANSYIIIIYIFLICSVMYNFYAGVLRSLGDSRSPLIFMIISAVLNIVLDIVSIIYFGWGVAGAAAATVFSQGVAAVLSFIYIKRKYTIFRSSKEEWQFDPSLSRTLLGVGMPGAVMFSITAISVIVVQMALNAFGSESVAAYSCANKIETIVTQFYPSLGLAVSSYASQNLGAGKIERIRKGFRLAVYIEIAYSVFGLLMCNILARPCTYIFIDNIPENASIIEESVLYVKTMGWFFIPLGSIFIFRTGSQGLGSGKIPLLSSVIELTARIATAFSMTYLFGFFGICLSNATSWICAGSILPFVYLRYIKSIERKHGKSDVSSSIKVK